MKRTLAGAPSGSGAVYAWEGSRKVGAGRMEIKDAAPPSKLVIQLEFIRPFKSHNVTEFTLVLTYRAGAFQGPSLPPT